MSITGSGLTGVTRVLFGGTPGTAVTVESATEVRVTTPARSGPGAVDVGVRNAAGTSSASAAYTYAAPPSLAALSPRSGPTTGGTEVTITGQNLSAVTGVTFGTTAATDVRVASPTTLVVTAPARGGSGDSTVRVRTAGGTSETPPASTYRYADAPTITAVTPATGSEAGGTVLTITGTHLGETSMVSVGGQAAEVITVSTTQVRAATPSVETPGPAEIRLTTPGGTTPAAPEAVFTYAALPGISSLAPTAGALAGGTVVTLRGADLAQVTAVTFGDLEGTDLEVLSDSELRVTTPPSESTGAVDLRVSSPAGISAAATTSFHYAAAAGTQPVAESDRSLIPLGLIGLLSWSVWGIRRYLSRHRYTPVVNDFRTTTSVVVPVYREDADVLERCLRTWVRESPTEIILVVDDRDETLLERLYGLPFPDVTVMPWRHTGKRGALGAGVRAARGEVIVFADSDTEWRPGLLAAMQMPFVDPMVGGVGSRQHVYLPASSMWRRVAYWMLNSRYLDYVPAMSRRGAVACLSGRTSAYRRSVVLPLMPALEKEIFLGKECVAGDDGRLTWLTLAAGYQTVHQETAEADSMFPSELRAFLKQRVRWSRNSYRCYLTAVSQGWLWRMPFITQVTVLQILLTPVSMGATIWYGAQWVGRGGWLALIIVLAWAVVGRALRATSHLMENPRDIVLAPVVALVIATIALPVKLQAAITMNKQGWLTRQDGDRVQGQGEIEVPAHAGVS